MSALRLPIVHDHPLEDVSLRTPALSSGRLTKRLDAREE
jgi:hypothetical protein